MIVNRLVPASCSPAVSLPSLAWAVLALLVLATGLSGCAKKALPGYGAPLPAATQVQQAGPDIDPDHLPEGWGYVDVVCRKGVGRERGQKDTLFGCLLDARETGTGTIILPPKVYLGHVAGFIVRALRFYHVEQHFEDLYGYRIVLVFRPASAEEAEDMENEDLMRFAAGTAGEMALTVLGAPLVPIVAPVVFAFESVDADQEFQAYKREAEAKGLPEPTRRGGEIVIDEYAERYGRYWDAVAGDGEPEDRVPGMYVVQACYLDHPQQGRADLARPKPLAPGAKPPTGGEKAQDSEASDMDGVAPVPEPTPAVSE